MRSFVIGLAAVLFVALLPATGAEAATSTSCSRTGNGRAACSLLLAQCKHSRCTYTTTVVAQGRAIANPLGAQPFYSPFGGAKVTEGRTGRSATCGWSADDPRKSSVSSCTAKVSVKMGKHALTNSVCEADTAPTSGNLGPAEGTKDSLLATIFSLFQPDPVTMPHNVVVKCTARMSKA